MTVSDGGSGLRKQILVLSEQTHTQVPYWLGMRLTELMQWVNDYIALRKQRQRELEAQRRKFRRR